MTFEEFQATGKSCNDLGEALKDATLHDAADVEIDEIDHTGAK